MRELGLLSYSINAVVVTQLHQPLFSSLPQSTDVAFVSVRMITL